MTETLALIVLTIVVVVDIVQNRLELLELRKLARSTAKSSSTYEVKIECDNADALAKIDQVRIAAAQCAAELQNMERLKPMH